MAFNPDRIAISACLLAQRYFKGRLCSKSVIFHEKSIMFFLVVDDKSARSCEVSSLKFAVLAQTAWRLK